MSVETSRGVVIPHLYGARFHTYMHRIFAVRDEDSPRSLKMPFTNDCVVVMGDNENCLYMVILMKVDRFVFVSIHSAGSYVPSDVCRSNDDNVMITHPV